MAIQARVTSTDALEMFRAKLVIFMGKARVTLDDVTDEVRRTRVWLQHDQPMRWEGEIRRRTKILDQAMHELRNAQFAGQEAAIQTRQAAVNRAKQGLAEAEDKLRRIKKWNQNYDNISDPIVRRLDGFRGFVTDELPKGAAHLRNIQKALEAYAEANAALQGGGAAAPASGENEKVESGQAAPATEPPAT
ncbi:MAG TPA: hypothetical protein VL981_12360 [Candidatus Methylacidiphilales bacterium]|nr:hypothetical protein [Candidatus Methylacidiphilales bacterium]